MATDDRDTRTRILAHGADLIRRDGIAAVRVADVAAGAGVSRQAVYLHFGTRAGLLTEIARHLDLTTPRARAVRAAIAIDPPERALEAFVRAYLRYLPTALPLLTALEAAAATDDAAREAWRSRKDALHGMIGAIVRRLAAAGGLQPRWSVARATDWALVLLHPKVHTELVAERGWAARAAADHLVAEITGALSVRGATRI